MKPDPASQHAQVEAFQRQHRTGLVTLVFTDIAGSTQLKQELGDRQAVALIQKHHAVVRELLAGFVGAREISAAGDSFFLVFDKPSDAVKFALLLLGRLRQFAQEGGHALADRVGIHVGEVVIEQEASAASPKDLYGIHVDICARVMGLAGANQILLTRSAFDNARAALRGEDLPGVGELRWANHGPYLLKGVEEPVEICEVRAAEGALTPPATTEKAQRHVSPDAEPVLGWRPAIDQLVPNTKWVLEQKLGEGGFGEVWLGRHQTMKERRVFKFCFRADRVRFLKREMTLFRLLKERVGDHPNIVRLLEVYFDEPPFYVEMDYVEGKDLKSWCEAQGGVDKVPLEVRLEIVAQVADALQAAHDAGVIHRDVKPTNVLVSGVAANWRSPQTETRRPEVRSPESPPARAAAAELEQAKVAANASSPLRVQAKLTDFGIGQVVSAEYLAGITQAGFTQTLMSDSSTSHTGTQLYVAPELLAGKPASTRSDIYSLGVVLYQTVVSDFTRPLTTDWADHISDALLRDDLKHCFAGNPQDRFAGAGQLAKNLRALPQRRAALAEQQAQQAARERAAFRRGLVRATSLATLIVLAMAALALTAIWQRNRARAQELSNRRLLYAAEVNLAGHAWRDGNIFRTRELLLDQRPRPGQEDLRGFEWRFLWQFCRGDDIATLHGHKDLAQSVAVSPDGQLLASGDMDADGLVHIWSVAQRRELNPPLRLGLSVRCVVFSHDGKLLAAGGYDGKLKLWESGTWREVAAFDAVGRIERIALSPDGKWLAAGVIGPEPLKMWNLESKESAGGFKGPAYERPCVAFSPDSRLVAYGLGDKSVKLVEVTTQRELRTLRGHENIVVHLEFSPDGQTLATASEDSTVKLWDVGRGQEIGSLLGHKARVTSVAFAPNGRTLATSCGDATIKLWDFASRKELATLVGHTNWVNNVVFFPDGKLLASGSDDKTIKLWDAHPRERTQGFEMVTNGVAYAQMSPDRKSFLTVGTDNSVALWEIGAPAPRAALRPASTVRVASEWSQDGHTVTMVEEDGRVRLLDSATGRQRAAWTTPAAGEPSAASVTSVPAMQQTAWTTRAAGLRVTALTADGRTLAILGVTTNVTLWDTATGRSTGVFKAENLDSLLSPPDGRILAVKYDEASIQLWDVIKQRLVVTFRAKGGWRSGLVVSDSFELVAHGSEEGKVWLSKFAIGDPLGPLAGHLGPIWRLRFSPDGKTLASGSGDNTAKLWDLEHLREVATLRGHSGWVVGLDFSPDGKTLATVSNDGTIKLWSLSSFREVATLPGHVSIFSRLAFSADGQTLLCFGQDKSLRLWRAPSFAEIEGADKLARGSR
ncbi:MAG: protein kinase [Verrucomicrobia bacterium]|nr:protein kinase [Verrucomicrobiota bacterium]